jgi:protein phosphatase
VLVVLVGASGSGKSTWAAGRFRPDAVLSSDAFRALVSGDASDQSASDEAFRALHVILGARLRRGLLTVVDATNLTSPARRSLLARARAAGRPSMAVVFDVPLEVCLARNARRPGRRVPETVVRRQCRQLAGAMAGLADEGFDEIRVVGATDRDGRYDGEVSSEAATSTEQQTPTHP